MTAKNLSKTQQQTWTKHLEAQGCRVQKTKKGLMVFFPDGGQDAIHTSTSDRRAMDNAIANFRRHNVIHPLDTAQIDPDDDSTYPDYLKGGITLSTRKKFLAWLEAEGFPLRLKVSALPFDGVTAGRTLYATGWRWDPQSKPTRRVWVAPEDIRQLREKVNPPAPVIQIRNPERTANEIADIAVESKRRIEQVVASSIRSETADQKADAEHAAAAVVARSEPVVASHTKKESSAEQVREFIDTHDSWTVDAPPAEVQSYLDILRGAGLHVEIRVWR